jgi:hypothetical protein
MQLQMMQRVPQIGSPMMQPPMTQMQPPMHADGPQIQPPVQPRTTQREPQPGPQMTPMRRPIWPRIWPQMAQIEPQKPQIPQMAPTGLTQIQPKRTQMRRSILQVQLRTRLLITQLPISPMVTAVSPRDRTAPRARSPDRPRGSSLPVPRTSSTDSRRKTPPPMRRRSRQALGRRVSRWRRAASRRARSLGLQTPRRQSRPPRGPCRRRKQVGWAIRRTRAGPQRRPHPPAPLRRPPALCGGALRDQPRARLRLPRRGTT